MSLTNHIIIPVVGSKQTLEDQNIFLPSYFTLTPQKQEDAPDLTFWKKSMSAFKKFKDKKERRDRLAVQDYDAADNHCLPASRKFVRLIIRKPMLIDINSLMLLSDSPNSSFGYFDPNAAPLYELRVTLQCERRDKELGLCSKTEKMYEEMQSVKLVKIQSYMVDEEPALEPIIQPRFDDPFIIIRKQNIKKSAKMVKTKYIKKDKPAVKDHHRQRLIPEIPKESTLMHHEASHLAEKPVHHQRESLDQLHAGNEEMSSGSESLSDKPSPQRRSKEIDTLQQLVAKANKPQRKQVQDLRAAKEKGGSDCIQ